MNGCCGRQASSRKASYVPVVELAFGSFWSDVMAGKLEYEVVTVSRCGRWSM